MIQSSTQSTPKVRDPLSILLVGPPGGGKTTIAMQFPGVCFLDIDEKLDGPESLIRKSRPDLSYSFIQAGRDEKGNRLPSGDVFKNLLSVVGSLKGNKEIQTIVLDNLTMLSEFVIQDILKTQKKDAMTGGDWGPYKSKMVQILLNALREPGKHVIVLAHEFHKEVAKPGNMMEKILVGRRPTIQGKMDDILGGYFSDMWRCSGGQVGGKQEFYIETMPTGLDELKNTLGLPPKITVKEGELAWKQLEPFFKAKNWYL